MELATIEKNGWMLEDGEKKNQKWPQSFRIPNISERSNLSIGQYARCMFSYKNEKGEIKCERMWVVITKVLDSSYVGNLDNDPYSVIPLKCGDEVYLEPKHVMGIYEE